MKKRGISPVVASVLLVLIVIVLAIIIFLWARGFIKEHVEKFNQPVEMSCESVSFSASISGESLYIINNGNVPIYAIDVKKNRKGGSEVIKEVISLSMGGATNRDISPLSDVNSVLVVPILLGKTKSGNTNEYTCPDANGNKISI